MLALPEWRLRAPEMSPRAIHRLVTGEWGGAASIDAFSKNAIDFFVGYDWQAWPEPNYLDLLVCHVLTALALTDAKYPECLVELEAAAADAFITFVFRHVCNPQCCPLKASNHPAKVKKYNCI
jgi:hypothetical protein